MPPIHPDFVHFAIAFVVVAFGADLLGAVRHRPRVLGFGWACLLLGLGGTAATIFSGLSDMDRAHLNRETHALVELHLRIGIVVGASVLGLTVWRGWIAKAGPTAQRMGPFLVCFALVVGLLSFQGWFGGELAYAHGAGAAAAGQGMHPEAEARSRLDRLVPALHQIPGLHPEQRKDSARGDPGK